MILFGIASYHRPECNTYNILRNIGINNESIIIGLNDPDDEQRYKNLHKDANIIVRAGNSAAFNRNTLLNHVKSRVVLLDDDITAFKMWDGNNKSKNGKYKALNGNELIKEFEQCFLVAEKNNAQIFGFSANDNSMNAKARMQRWGKYTPDVMIQGTVTGILTPKDVFFDERYLMVEDYELSCRIIASGGHTLRRNDLVAIKPQNGTNEGGLHERYAAGEQKLWINRLCRQWARIVKPTKDCKGVQMKI